jgi:hypothetical protein
VAALALLWAGLVLTLSQSSFTALLAGLVVLGALRWGRRRAALLVAAFAAAGALAVIAAPGAVGVEGSADNVSSGRWSLVRGGVELASARPLQGWGASSFKREYRRQEKASSARASAASHTIPVTVAAEQGAAGVIVYAALIAVALLTLFGGLRRVAPGLGAPGEASSAPSPARALAVGRIAIAAAFGALLVHTVGYGGYLTDPLTWVLLAIGGTLAVAARR